MKLKRNFIIFFIWIHLILAGFTFVFFDSNLILFLLLESLVILSAIVTLYFYKLLFRPFRLLQASVESIADKDFSIKFKQVGQRDMDRLITVYNKMIDQLRFERTKQSEKHFFLEKLIDASPAGIILMDMDGRIESLNTQAGYLFHGNDVVNKYLDNLPGPWCAELPDMAENSSRIIRINGINHYKCYKSYFYDRGVKRYFFVIEELTKELLYAERKAYEKVIRMMSHEVNNTVGAINSIIDSTLGYMQQNDNGISQDFILALEAAQERNQNLNRFTGNFAKVIRLPDPDIQELDLQEWLLKIRLLVVNNLKEKRIQLELKNDQQMHIKADPQQLEQVVVNVLKNAAEACNEGNIIRIIADATVASLTIENNGEPILEDARRKLFEPFYTTKKHGQGIGLTLSREILINHGFGFSLSTNTEGITQFRILFRKINSPVES